LDNTKYLGKKGNLDIYLFPSLKFIIDREINSDNEKKQSLSITKEPGCKIIMVIQKWKNNFIE